MAIIKCPECGHDVSNKASSCPNCGYILEVNPIDKNSHEANNTRSSRQQVIVQPELPRHKTLIEILLDKISDMISNFFWGLFVIGLIVLIVIVIYNYPRLIQIMQDVANG